MSPAGPRRPEGPGEIIFEFVRAGAYMRCTAVDPATGVEATAVGPASNHLEPLKRLAIGKLKRALETRGR